GEGEGEGEGDADADADAEGDADADADGDAAAAAAADGDGDGIADTTDNCTSVSNVDQKDTDADRMGDACDPDDDNDGILDDGNYTVIIGDSYCEPDDTGNCDDNCITVSNVDQADFDEDHIGDACDLDSDNDGLCDHDTLCTDIDNSERLVDLWYFVSQDATKSPPSVEGGYSYRFIEGKGAGAIIVVQGLTDRTLAEGTVGRCPGSGTTAKVGICILDFSIK
ncbi:MAG TPA: thrombospondin type 3 repeat-containing protein, partial [bacterium]|nr:thrombospondin type 3 repeat-containing protein [bacterium]